MLKRLSYLKNSDIGYIVLIFVLTRLYFIFVAWVVPSLVTGHYAAIGSSLMNGDGGWYFSIAQNGYASVPYNAHQQYNWAFYPMFPYLTKWLAGSLGDGAMKITGYIISNVSFLGFLYVLHKWVLSLMDNGPVARLTTLLAGLSPILPYFVGYRPSSLFMLLSTLSLLLMSKERWLMAAVVGALTSLDRPTGLLLALPYILYVLLRTGYPFWKRVLFLIPAFLFWTGFVTLMVVDHRLTGNALAFMKIESQWNRHLILPFKLWWDWLKHPTLLDSSGWGIPALAILLSVVAILSSLVFVRDKKSWPLLAYLVIPTIFVNSYTVFNGIQRYVLELTPIYLALAMIASKYRREAATKTAFWITMTLYSVVWSLGVHAVLS